MSRIWKVGLLATAVFLLMASFYVGQETQPSFSLKDRELIETYYTHLLGTLAPGSVDRSPFPLGIEKVLVVGSHVPMQLEKDIGPSADKAGIAVDADYRRLRALHTGTSCCLDQEADLAIADILKNVAVKETPK
jgi:hypothetical protein